MEAVEAVHLQDVADGHLVVDRVPAVAIVSAIEKAHAPHHAIEFAGNFIVPPPPKKDRFVNRLLINND